ncbi:MAG: hypothetical protein QOI74_938, partial [Micromonosporaceae bacterium]|nr:hypothetical protein [Micromonosporaceae bacterium]
VVVLLASSLKLFGVPNLWVAAAAVAAIAATVALAVRERQAARRNAPVAVDVGPVGEPIG